METASGVGKGGQPKKRGQYVTGTLKAASLVSDTRLWEQSLLLSVPVCPLSLGWSRLGTCDEEGLTSSPLCCL